MSPNGGTGALELNYRQVLTVCDVLEGIADALPRVDTRLCMETADTIEPLMERTHELEEGVLFPILAASGRQELNRTIARLRQEHLTDMCTAGEVSDTLRAMAIGHAALSPDAQGYLLRAFFDSMRRHVHGELELLRLMLPNQGTSH